MAEGSETWEGGAVPLYGESKIQGTTAANDVLTIEGASGQSGDLLVLQNSSGTEFLSFTSAGYQDFGDDILLRFGASQDVTFEWDTALTPDQFIVAAAADDTVIRVGAASSTQLSFDLQWRLNTSAVRFDIDASANTVGLLDSAILGFGNTAAAPDVYTRWDATDMDWLATADNTVMKFGNSTNTFDIHLLGSTAGARVVWDSSLNALNLNASAQNARTYLNMGTLANSPTTGVAIGDMFMYRTGTVYRMGIVVTGTSKKFVKFSLTAGG